jgi:hypothetical protein
MQRFVTMSKKKYLAFLNPAKFYKELKNGKTEKNAHHSKNNERLRNYEELKL